MRLLRTELFECEASCTALATHAADASVYGATMAAELCELEQSKQQGVRAARCAAQLDARQAHASVDVMVRAIVSDIAGLEQQLSESKATIARMQRDFRDALCDVSLVSEIVSRSTLTISLAEIEQSCATQLAASKSEIAISKAARLTEVAELERDLGTAKSHVRRLQAQVEEERAAHEATRRSTEQIRAVEIEYRSAEMSRAHEALQGALRTGRQDVEALVTSLGHEIRSCEAREHESRQALVSMAERHTHMIKVAPDMNSRTLAPSP